MNQATDTFVKNDHKSLPFHANSFYGQARTLLDELHVHHME